MVSEPAWVAGGAGVAAQRVIMENADVGVRAAPPLRYELGVRPYRLIRGDRIYGTVVTRRLRAMGIRDKPIATASPWQNGFAERLIGSLRRECLDHIIVLDEEHLRRILKNYAAYYNGVRTHRSLQKRMRRSLVRFSDPVP